MEQTSQPRVCVETAQHGPVRQINLKAYHPQGRTPAVLNLYQVGGTLIDAGSFYVQDQLIDALADDPPTKILLTHHHEDHIAGLQRLRDAFGEIPVYAPRNLVPFIQQVEPLTMVRRLFWGPADPFADLIAFDPGETFSDGDLELESIETPGHCPYHCSFVVRHRGSTYVLSGDLYYRRKPLVIWHESAADDAIASCRALASLDHEITLMPAHVTPATDGASVLNQQADWIDREAETVRQAADHLGTRDYGQIVTYLYGPPDPFESLSDGQLTKASFVRSVLDPVKTLPPVPIRYP